jgi:RNA polymerase sigma-32 factor
MIHGGDPVADYLANVRRYQPLSREQELALVERWQQHGDTEARSTLLLAHLSAVTSIALKYRHYGVPMDELISEGNLGVVHALSKFDPSRGTRFMTYAAFWIRAHILNHVIGSWSMVSRSSALRSKVFFKLRRERARIRNLVGDGEQADAMLAERLGLPQHKVMSMINRLEARDVSLDSAAFDDSATSLVDTLPSPEPSHEDTFASQEVLGRVRDALEGALASLDARERYIVEQRLMADSEDERSLADLGRRLGVSRERARQLETRTRRKLKKRIVELSGVGMHLMAL